MSQSSPAGPAVACVFVRPPGCAHAAEPLFSSEYKRTNRTRATKIVRCFPHCCPEHRPRSYCGTALHVQVSSASARGESDDDDAETGSVDQLIVYGRFEAHRPQDRDGQEDGVTELQVGQRVRSSAVTETAGAAGSIWVKGERVRDSDDDDVDDAAPPSRMLFALQGSDDEFQHWESDWKSGTSQQHRQTPHHFRVYVFARSARDSHEWQVVATATSPLFTFAVYRKHQHNAEVLRLKEIQSAQASEQASTTASGGDGNVDDHDVMEEGDHQSLVDLNNQGAPLSLTTLRDLVWHRQHRGAAISTTNIAILVLLAYEGDPAWLAAQPRALFTLLEAATGAASVPNHLLLHYVNHCVPQLVALLPHQAERLASSQPPSERSGARSQALMETIAELLCAILDPGLTKPVLAFVSAYACLPTLTDDKRRELLLQWIDMITEQVESFFQLRGRSTDAFVDDVVSVALRERAGPTKRLVREMLRNTRVLGLAHFDALLAKLRFDAHAEDQPSALVPAADDEWAGRWLCRGFARAAGVDGRPERRRSWPQVAAVGPRLDSASGLAVHVGMMAAIAAILSGVGFDLGLCGDQGDTLRVVLLTAVLDKPRLEVPLDHEFRDAAHLLPLEWATLLAVGRLDRRVFCRARPLESGNEDNDRLELEFFTYVPDPASASVWRCLLRFEIASRGLLASSSVLQRRRLVLHVQVDEAEHDIEDSGSKTSDDENETDLDARKHRDSGRSTESDLPPRHHVVSDNDEANERQRLYTRVERWRSRLAFQGIYYALE